MKCNVSLMPKTFVKNMFIFFLVVVVLKLAIKIYFILDRRPKKIDWSKNRKNNKHVNFD